MEYQEKEGLGVLLNQKKCFEGLFERGNKDTKSTEKESTEVNLLTIRGQGLEDKNISMDPTTQEDSKII